MDFLKVHVCFPIRYNFKSGLSTCTCIIPRPHDVHIRELKYFILITCALINIWSTMAGQTPLTALGLTSKI